MDMHLMTLKTLAIEMGMETPDIFKDETYLRMHRYGLLTSQVSCTAFRVLVQLKLIFLLPNRKEYKNNGYLIIIRIFFFSLSGPLPKTDCDP